MRNISINWQGCLICCVFLWCCGPAGSVELLGSPNPEIKKNFNQLLTTNACPGCNLSGAVLNRLNLADADLEGADLSGARLSGTSLAGANLHNAVLRGAWLGGADLSGANLLGTDLEWADFTLGVQTETENPGRLAVDSAQQTVNSAIDSLFAARQQAAEPLPQSSAPTGGQKQVAASQSETERAAAQPQEEIPILFAPFEPASEEQSARRNVDEVPVIQHDSLLLETDEKKSGKAATPQKSALPERINEIVLDQVWPPLVAAPSQQSGATAQTGQSCPRPPAPSAQPKN